MPLESDFPKLDGSDLIVFANKEALDPAFTNQRAPRYEQYTREHFGDTAIEVADGVRIYVVKHHLSVPTNEANSTGQNR